VARAHARRAHQPLGRISLRFGPYDFNRKSRDGLGDDWPITYDDVKPWYDEVDKLIGIFGSAENLPNEPDGIFHPPPTPRCYELLATKAAEKLGSPSSRRGCRSSRSRTTAGPVSLLRAVQPRLHDASNFSSTTCSFRRRRRPAADAHHRRDGARGDGRQGRPRERRELHRQEDRDRQAHLGRIVVLAASACETARLLLNSKSSQFPNGLANSSGTVGKYLTDTTGTDVSGFIPKMMDMPPHNEDGVAGCTSTCRGGSTTRSSTFRAAITSRRTADVACRVPASWAAFRTTPAVAGTARHSRETTAATTARRSGSADAASMIPNDDCYCEIDPTVVDQYGIPVLRFHWKWTDHEYNQVKHMQETFRAIIAEMGGRCSRPCRRRSRATASRTAARSSTSWAARGWARTPRRRS
jgi:choline dehydrogenase-like flavoprotein